MDFRLRVQQVHKPIFMSLLSLLFPLHVHLAAKVNKVERVEHNPVELTVEVPRPVVIEKTIEALHSQRFLCCTPLTCQCFARATSIRTSFCDWFWKKHKSTCLGNRTLAEPETLCSSSFFCLEIGTVSELWLCRSPRFRLRRGQSRYPRRENEGLTWGKDTRK